MQLKNTTEIHHINGLPMDWKEKTYRTHQLFSKVPYYNSKTVGYSKEAEMSVFQMVMKHMKHSGDAEKNSHYHDHTCLTVQVIYDLLEKSTTWDNCCWAHMY